MFFFFYYTTSQEAKWMNTPQWSEQQWICNRKNKKKVNKLWKFAVVNALIWKFMEHDKNCSISLFWPILPTLHFVLMWGILISSDEIFVPVIMLWNCKFFNFSPNVLLKELPDSSNFEFPCLKIWPQSNIWERLPKVAKFC